MVLFLLRTLESVWTGVVTAVAIAALGGAGVWAWLEHTESGQQVVQTIKVVNEIQVYAETNGGLAATLEKINLWLDQNLQ